jgi:hypothetical protein
VNWRDYAKHLRKQGREIPAAVAMPVFRRRVFRVLQVAVQNSPVNFGTLRRGWHLTIDAPSGQQVEAGKSDAGVLQAAERVLAKLKFGEGVWIQNNEPHAAVYEFGGFIPPNPGPSKATHVPKSRRDRVAGRVLIQGGFHVVAPNGMLRDAVDQAAAAARAGTL